MRWISPQVLCVSGQIIRVPTKNIWLLDQEVGVQGDGGSGSSGGGGLGSRRGDGGAVKGVEGGKGGDTQMVVVVVVLVVVQKAVCLLGGHLPTLYTLKEDIKVKE